MSESPEDLERRCLDALAAARAFLIYKAPYFSSTLYGLVPKVLPGMLAQTGGKGGFGVTRGMVLYMDPEWFLAIEDQVDQTLSVTDRRKEATEIRGGLLAHEVMHILRDLERIEAMPNQELANIAFDLPINHDLEKAEFKLPEGGCYPRTFGLPEGHTGEQYYDMLQKKMPDVQKYCGGRLGHSGHGDGDSAGDNSGGKKGDQQNGGGQQDQRGPAAGHCGSCAGSPLSKSLEQKLDAEIGRTPADVKRLRDETMQAVKEAASMGRGTVPGSLEEMLQEKPGPSVVPWRMTLSRVIRRATGRIVCGQADYSMRYPSKKSYTRGIIRPGMVDRKVVVALIEDSSGSMGAQQLLPARAETVGVFKQLGIDEAWWFDADSDVAVEPRRIRMRDVATLPVYGRGGTDFRPALDAVRKLKPKPDICIYYTDGDGVAPEHPPQDIEVVWCIVPTPNGRRPARWGHLVVVSDDQKLRDPYER